MKHIRLIQIIIFSLFLSPLWMIGQEVLLPLTANPVLIHATEKNEAFTRNETFKAATISQPLTLPFFDDFTQDAVYPEPSRWMDWHVYVNSDFAFRSFNRGVATFDALDSAGNIYSTATYTPFEADKLTSRPIRLDSLLAPQKRAITISDSIYLSFYYQPQGLGNDPQPADSLLLQFLATDPTPYWVTVWGSPGMKLDTFYTKYGTYSRRVNVPITDSATFYRPDFQFRFVAYASLSGDMLPSWQSSMDHWNVDAVKVNIDGRYNDSTQRWIGFAEKAPSMLKDFYAVPYTQYSDRPEYFMTDTLSVFITNRNGTNLSARYGYQVLKANGSTIFSYNGGDNTIAPFLTSGYFSENGWARPPVRSILPIDPYGVQDSAVFTITHTLKGDESGASGLGDTIVFSQKMTNFFAYDDGIPELGYGLTPAGAQLAVRFALSKADTLRAVRLYFNKVVGNANQQYFKLTVWDDNNGMPGQIINDYTVVRPMFADSIFRYYQITLEKSVPVRNAFYVGWIQNTNDNLNIGFDRSRDNSKNNFFNSDGTWQNSQYPGSIMIRPVIGKALLQETEIPAVKSSGLELWPNVWSHSGNIRIVINGIDDAPAQIELFDLSGRMVFSVQSFDGTFNPSQCQQGVYLVKVTLSSAVEALTQKLIITK